MKCSLFSLMLILLPLLSLPPNDLMNLPETSLRKIFGILMFANVSLIGSLQSGCRMLVEIDEDERLNMDEPMLVLVAVVTVGCVWLNSGRSAVLVVPVLRLARRGDDPSIETILSCGMLSIASTLLNSVNSLFMKPCASSCCLSS